MEATVDQARVKPGPPSRREVELAARVEVLEARQQEIITALAGVCQAGKWLQNQIALGQA